MARRNVIIVLWGERCDEALAVLWVSHMRAAGRRVYLVAVSGRQCAGSYGVTLQSDIGLSEALGLAGQVSQAILPCCKEALLTFRRDPRFDELLTLLGKNGAQFLVHPLARETVAGLVPGVSIRLLSCVHSPFSTQSHPP